MKSYKKESINKVLSLIIPVYNEEHNIIPLIKEISEKISTNYIAFIIYDFEEDSTLKKSKEIQGEYDNIFFIKNKFEKNVIGAFKTGFDISETEYIVPIMADLSDAPETINIMLPKIKEGFDLVIASRYMPGGDKIGGPKLKKFLSKRLNLTLKNITKLKVHDITNAFIIYKKESIKSIDIQSKGGFEITMEIIAKAYENNWKISEVPTINRERNSGTSKFRILKWSLNYLYWFVYILKVDFKKRLL
tara:strand:- start:5453 stop:6193 length:741 start_codon:yes stop_codon:yes gene_type:complete